MNKKKTVKSIRRARHWGLGRVLPIAGKMAVILAAVVVMGLMFSALQAIGSVLLRDIISLAIVSGILLMCYSEGLTRGVTDVDASHAADKLEKEGYAWARRGIDTQRAAVEYLKKYTERQGAIPQYMRALGLGDRMPVASEEKYLAAWQEMGFPPETVALACDKTVLKCHELKWAYCNGILKRWHEAGLHTPEDVQRADRPPAGKAPVRDTGDAWKYV